MGVGDVPNLTSLAKTLGCGVETLPSTYLWLPLGEKYTSKALWDPVIERFSKRFSGWKAKYISKGGRVTLLKKTENPLTIFLLCPSADSIWIELFTGVGSRFRNVKEFLTNWKTRGLVGWDRWAVIGFLKEGMMVSSSAMVGWVSKEGQISKEGHANIIRVLLHLKSCDSYQTRVNYYSLSLSVIK
ncbi:hypothetical protein GIB67_033582 [Kingdonia uniflora]|uniref:Uncharacterized protein n=1 Tax=Kingdonia uniflora TaxID=39325 RepID=A0A7J7L2D6_9MAGN|nr:hypothetical protein GIB67_033582 [Kingdonia uniflora]